MPSTESEDLNRTGDGLFWPFSRAEILGSRDFYLAVAVTILVAIVPLLAIETGAASFSGIGSRWIPVSIALLTVSFAVSGIVLGLVLAAVAVVTAFGDVKLFAKMWARDHLKFHRYFGVLFFPIRLAILTIVVSLVWLPIVYIRVGGPAVCFVASLTLIFLISWQMGAVYLASYQIQRAIATRARTTPQESIGHADVPTQSVHDSSENVRTSNPD